MTSLIFINEEVGDIQGPDDSTGYYMEGNKALGENWAILQSAFEKLAAESVHEANPMNAIHVILIKTKERISTGMLLTPNGRGIVSAFTVRSTSSGEVL